jgi:hypothetical protein
MTMRRLRVLTPAFVMIAACGNGPTKQKENLSDRSSGPEQLANESATTAAQRNFGDTKPDQPAGPTSDRGSGTGGDSVSSQ